MEPVRTSSQSVVIFIFLMITIFSFNNDDNTAPSSYTELYREPEEWAVRTSSRQSSYLHPELQKRQTSAIDRDTLYHRANYQELKRLRNKFTDFVHPVGVVWAAR